MNRNETAVTMLWGALAAAGAYGLFLAGKKATETSRALVNGLNGIGHIALTNQKLVESSTMVATELQLLRSMMTAPQAQEAGEQPASGGVNRPKTPPNPFPAPNMNLYADVPEATIEDTTVDDTEDAVMVKYEELESVRQQGFEADPGELTEA